MPLLITDAQPQVLAHPGAVLPSNYISLQKQSLVVYRRLTEGLLQEQGDILLHKADKALVLLARERVGSQSQIDGADWQLRAEHLLTKKRAGICLQSRFLYLCSSGEAGQ